MAFLASRAGKWAIRALALAVTWVILVPGLGIDWYGTGDPFLIGLFAIMLACGVYALGQLATLVLDITGMRQPSSSARVQWQGSIPPLSQARQARVRRLHKVMTEAGVFAPGVPDPALAFAAFAVDQQPVDWVGVLQSLAEAPYYHPGLDEASWQASWNANLLHDHVPSAWLTPLAGKVAAILWEDEAIFLSLVDAGSMAALEEPVGPGASWSELTEDVLRQLAAAGVPVR